MSKPIKLRAHSARRRWREYSAYFLVTFMGSAAGLGYALYEGAQSSPASIPFIFTSSAEPTAFSLCGRPPHSNCVVDGDTFYIGRQSVRIADIDAPETHPSRCSYEAALGERATHRLRELLNIGPVTLEGIGRDVDRYGRQLRIVRRDGKSLGAILVSEGLARKWTGRRQPWCS